MRLETIGRSRKLGFFLNSDKRQHRDTAAQDIQRQFREVTGREIPFKLTFEKVSSEPNVGIGSKSTDRRRS